MQLGDGVKLVICMVGVSGCGKTYFPALSISYDVRYVANKIRRFLTWKGYQARVFSCTEVRKKNYPSFSSPSAEYWNPNNEEVWRLVGQRCKVQMVKLRMQVLNDTMNEMFGYLRENGQVGILDGSNTSHSLREYITGKIAQEVGVWFVMMVDRQPNVHLPLWIEMRMNDSSIRIRRFQREKLFSIEYMGYDFDHAMKDYENRVAFQMQGYVCN